MARLNIVVDIPDWNKEQIQQRVYDILDYITQADKVRAFDVLYCICTNKIEVDYRVRLETIDDV